MGLLHRMRLTEHTSREVFCGEAVTVRVVRGLSDGYVTHSVAWRESVQGGACCAADYSIKSASRKGSMTPFWSLALSKPVADSARNVTVTLPAMSARFATAFHALNS